ncbi:protein-tyrosine phosphatase-like protein [Mycena rosella]|uniref:protein-tyrosine-phosphatase n=1 Tax=Mycena rosella TaxID=1033263 RepID=A0AAD7BSB1_MYCRO|nr:protein-tyrosine phosphatase-like protein [Mycena rosella]
MSAWSQRSSRVNSSPNREDITEVLPNLFLGSEAGASNLAMLRRNGITHVLSVLVPEASDAPDSAFTRMCIPVQDWPDEELMTHFRAANAFIDEARVAAGSGVLVHCQQGVSRSATVVAAYRASLPPTPHPLILTADAVMATHPPTPDAVSAIAFLQSLRPLVQPNAGFTEQLALYGRCDCDLEEHPIAVEAWRAARDRRWEGRVDRMRREQGGVGEGMLQYVWRSLGKLLR